jgi:hypothetical protein
MGRLALGKGEGEGEGLFEKLARAGREPLTLVLSPFSEGEAKKTVAGLLCIAVVIGLKARDKRSRTRTPTRHRRSASSNRQRQARGNDRF